MLPGIFYACLREMASFLKNDRPGTVGARHAPPACLRYLDAKTAAGAAGTEKKFSLEASKPLSGGILPIPVFLRQINLENERKVCYNLG